MVGIFDGERAATFSSSGLSAAGVVRLSPARKLKDKLGLGIAGGGALLSTAKTVCAAPLPIIFGSVVIVAKLRRGN